MGEREALHDLRPRWAAGLGLSMPLFFLNLLVPDLDRPGRGRAQETALPSAKISKFTS